MKLPFRTVAFLLLLGLPLVTAQARVNSVEVFSRTRIPGDATRPDYEKILGRVHFAIRPDDPHSKNIVDIDKAPLNRTGEVAFSADVFLIRPLEKSNGALLLEIPNRGGKGLLALLDGGKSDPKTEKDLGDGWLLQQGYTFASLGWQWDATGPDALRLYPPIASGATPEHPAEHLSGLLRDDFTPFEKSNEIELGHIMGTHLGGTEYAVSAPDDSRNVLTVRDSPHGARKAIPREQWSFSHTLDGKLIPSNRYLHLESGFVPGKIYELSLIHI